MKILFIFFSCLVISEGIYSKPTNSKATNNSIFQIRLYHLKDDNQVKMTDEFLKDAYLPALHRMGIKNIGVFKPIANDTAADKQIYVLIPFTSLDQWMKINERLNSDASFKSAGEKFLHADAKNPPFVRLESILLQPFSGQTFLNIPKTKDANRVFELRSYESPTWHLADKKRAMFNKDEMNIFSRLKFNPVFYAEVISGSHMPNLMYMPIFKSVEDRNDQWKVFGNDPKWKEISADPFNENNVSVNHIDSILMHSTDYSDY
ncbi:MAG TPA: NIPSNAP family protein [Hanamia sp.]|nr:NIPSNAP family protein [Hanamia sp.]